MQCPYVLHVHETTEDIVVSIEFIANSAKL